MTYRTFQAFAAAAALSVGSFTFAQQAGTSTDTTVARDPVTGDTRVRPAPSDGKGVGEPINREGMEGKQSNQSHPAGHHDDKSKTEAHSQDKEKAGMGHQNEADAKAHETLRMIASEPTKAADRLFVCNAAMSNLWEVEFAKVANERSQNPKIKELAKHIIEDHGNANEKLAPAAKELGLMIPRALPSLKEGELNVFRAMPVKNLETCFVVENKAGHAKAVTSYTDHAKTMQNEKLQAYVQETLPTLKAHTKMVIDTAQAMGIGGDLVMPGND